MMFWEASSSCIFLSPPPSLKAVERAAAVVICLSTAYKESSNCRLEADYALKLRKPLVFLQMQVLWADGEMHRGMSVV